jgi:hypothetical protein
MADSEPKFVPVRVGSMVIRDPVQLKTAFPDKEAYTALMEYFPATKGQPPVQSIPDDVAETLIHAFKQRIQGLSSVSPARMSKINGSKSALSITNLVHTIVQLQKRNLLPSSGKAPKRLRKKIQAMPVDKKRQLVFKLLWDLLHMTSERDEIGKAWDTILEDILSKEPYKLALQGASGPSQPIAGDVTLGALTAQDEKVGFSAFVKGPGAPVMPASPAEQLRRVYAVAELFKLDFNKINLPPNHELLKKMQEILNEYAVFYSKRHSSLIGDKGTITRFYAAQAPSVTVDLENSLLKLFQIISNIIADPTKLYAILNEQKGTLLLKLEDNMTWPDDMRGLITAYTEFINTNKGDYTDPATKKQIDSNDGAKGAPETTPGRLYQLNTTDRFVVRIINGSSIKYSEIGDIPESYKAAVDDNRKGRINGECRAYFKGKDKQLFLLLHVNKNLNDPNVHKIANIYTVTKNPDQPFQQGLLSLPKTGEIYTTLHKEDGTKLIDITYKPLNIYNSFTLPVLQLFVLKHITNKINSKT